MVEKVEGLSAKLDGPVFHYSEAAVQRNINYRVARPRQDVAARIAEGIWRRGRESARIIKMVSGTLAAWQQDGLTRYDVGTIRRARVGNIGRKLDRIQRSPILDG